jgi:glycosyltransferase involved in cell wall biosynthesis
VRLAALVDSPNHVCCRYRIAAFQPWLEQAGHALDLVSLPRRWWARWLLFRRLRGANVVVQRQLLPRWQLAILRRHVRHLLFDFDDAVFLRDSYSPRGLHHAGRLARFAATVRACDAVVAGNSFLAEQAARFVPADSVYVIPTCVDPASYPEGERNGDRVGDGRELVWVGSSSTLRGLHAIAPVLEEIGRRVPGTRLKIICDRFLELKHLPVIRCRWSQASEAAEIAAADIGIAWVPDDLWSKGKCGLKLLQYMAAGLPVIANPVGAHTEMVRQGVNGALVRTTEEWVEAVANLAADEPLRRRMGRASRIVLEAQYSVGVGAQRWLGLLGSLSRSTVVSA